MTLTRKRLGELLVDSNLISDEQLKVALEKKKDGEKLGETLIRNKYISEKQMIQVLEYQLGIPFVDLKKHKLDEKLLELVPKEYCKKQRLIPLKIEKNKLYVGMCDPLDMFVIDDLRMMTGLQIRRYIVTKADVESIIGQYFPLYEDVEEIEEVLEDAEDQGQEEVDQVEITDNDSPIVKMINSLIMGAVQQKVSDIHLDPKEKAVVVRYRIDGMLRTEKTLPKHMHNVMVARVKIMSNLDITEYRVPQDGRIRIKLNNYKCDLRVSTLPTVYGEKIVMRVLDIGSSSMEIDQMGFHPLHKKLFLECIHKPTGIVLISGPTGSGKTSTLYAALQQLNNDQVNIITVEDPVEYQLEGINQVQVNSDVGLSFAQGLRSILRQDPNVIMVGEIRDKETAEIAVRAALTGHLVLSTIHTNDSIKTISRLIDMGIERFLLTDSLSGIVAQRLVRRVCTECPEVYVPTESEQQLFAKRGLHVDEITRGIGCDHCSQSGYKGRLALYEILMIDEQICDLIINNRPDHEIRDYAMSNDTIFLIDDGLLKVKQGLTTPEEVIRVALHG